MRWKELATWGHAAVLALGVVLGTGGTVVAKKSSPPPTPSAAPASLSCPACSCNVVCPTPKLPPLEVIIEGGIKKK